MRKEFEIDLYDGHLIIEENGMKILVDTGSPVTIGRDSRFSFMEQSHHCVTSLMGTDISSVSRLMNYSVDVLLGMDVLKQYCILVDYRNKRVTFSTEGIPFDSATAVPLQCGRMGEVCVVLTVNGVEAKLALDTGAKISYIDETFTVGQTELEAREDFNPMVGRFQTTLYDMQASINGMEFPVHFGKLPSSLALTLQMLGLRGAIGYDLFDSFVVLMDFHNRVLSLRENS